MVNNQRTWIFVIRWQLTNLIVEIDDGGGGGVGGLEKSTRRAEVWSGLPDSRLSKNHKICTFSIDGALDLFYWCETESFNLS